MTGSTPPLCRSGLGPEDYLERRPAARRRDKAEAAPDRSRSRPHVLQPLARGDLGFVEPGAVVDDADEALALALLDPHFGPSRASVLPRVREAFLHDSEDLDLLVGRKPDPVLDLEIDLELAVRGQEVDVAPQRRVEWRRAAGRREREHCEPRLLLGGLRGLLQLRQRRFRRGAVLEHARVRRDREQVLREPVVDLARHSGALLGDGAAEFGEADRAPDADEEDAVRQQPQEVALRDVAVRKQRREDVVQLREERKRCAEAEPAVEVVAAVAEAQAPADHRDQREQRLYRQGALKLERLVGSHVLGDARQRRPRLLCEAPTEPEHDHDCDQHLPQGATAGVDAPFRERRRRDQDTCEEPSADPRPKLRPVQRVASEHRRDREGKRGCRRGGKPGAEQEVEPPPVDGEAEACEQRHDRRRERDGGVEHEPNLRPRGRVAQAGVGDEQRQCRAEQPDEEDLAPEPGLIVVTVFVPHEGLFGMPSPADKASVRILLVDDHPITRNALAALLAQHDFAVVGEASDGEEAVELARRLSPQLVLLDLSMPGLDGLQALPRIREAAPDCEVVVLTASGTEENLLAAIRGGAAGYLLKSEPPARIVEFLRGVARGEAALSGAVARRLLEQVRVGGGRSSGVPDQIAAALSARELEVLLLLDEHLATDEIARRLYISEHTVRAHVKSLLRKLGVSSRREALEALSRARAA